MSDHVKRVFLSSTVRGLQSFRDAVTDAINALPDCKCIRMEDFTASSDPPLDVCLKKLEGCDIYVGIIGHSYGSYIDGTETSFTEAEYDFAIKQGILPLMFMADEAFPISANEIEDESKQMKQKMFRDRLAKAHTRASFQTAPGLSLSVVTALHNTPLSQQQPFMQVSMPPALHRLAEVSTAVTKALQNTPSPQQPVLRKYESTILLFSFVTNQAGFDTGISICNTSARPNGEISKDGACTVYYYGSTSLSFLK